MTLFLNYLLESTLAMTLVWVLYKLVFEKLTFYSWNRFYLISGVILSLLLPLISITVWWTDERVPVQIINTFSASNLVKVPDYQDSIKGFSWSFIILLFYFSISFVLAFRLFYSLYTLSSKIRNAQKLKMNGVNLAIDPSFSASSFLYWVLISPKEVSSTSIRQIIEHESVHIQCGHTWDLLAFQVFKIIFWANPIFYFLEKCLKEVHEFQADAKVIEFIPVNEYSRLLVQSISSKMTGFIPSFNQFQTKKRIIMMNKPKSNGSERLRFLLGLPLVLLMMSLFSFQLGNSENELVGIWTGSDFMVELPDGSDFDALIDGGRRLHIDGKMVLNEDNTYQIQDPSGNVNGKGVWEHEGNVLRTKDEHSNVVEYKVIKLDDSNLVTEHSFNMETPEGVVSGNITLFYKR